MRYTELCQGAPGILHLVAALIPMEEAEQTIFVFLQHLQYIISSTVGL